MTQDVQQVVSISHTATSDTQFSLVQTDLWLTECNVEALTNNAKYGDFANQESTLNTGNVLFYRNINLADLFFKNTTPGSNTKIVMTGLRMTQKQKEDIGVA